ncbi:flagellar basal-body rod protein FlgF [Desulfohalobiaceae bacterium Ax17]|jgi:flagellar basal-body rod protein FlgG|uniref:flagellar basal-body rod protein FlgF n=1 Tax=Desulfovulcanus ferrireducens TaxID=2831190 RepID=UPI00207BADDE|nr:flagellar basal-body rod protein FlgF [Desulfovulcanus ferrireducens]MBT8763783.1 flagellar basal-body rod protein FlgF [Desulfovulcanus ferrireducens]
MQQGMYTALFGSLTQEYRMNIIANNLANVNTIGFKKDKLSFRDVFKHYAADYVNPKEALKDKILWPEAKVYGQTRIAESSIDFNQGAMRLTGNKLDLAIEGEGFFRVRTPDGQTAYTRNGRFQRDPRTGYMVTGQGFVLLGDGGPIELPENGDVVVTEKGQVVVGGEVVDNISLVSFNDLNGLEKLGRQLFRIKPGLNMAEIPAEQAWVKQGYLEDSNVEVVQEMVSMIDTMRTFESLQKVMTSSQEEDQKVIREVGTVR